MKSNAWMTYPVRFFAGRPFPGSWRALAFAAQFSKRLRKWPWPISDETTLTIDFTDTAASQLFRSDHLGHEKGLESVLAHLMKKDGCFWDVGANVGYYTGVFSERRFAQRQVYSFEPNPVLANRVREALMERSSVRVIQAGLGAEDGKATLHVPMRGKEAVSGLASFRPMKGKGVEVPVRSVDSLIREGFTAPDVMKIDVEGWEAAVLDGFQTKDAHRPAIHFEHIESAAVEAGSSFARMKSIFAGWELFRVESDGGLRSHTLETPRTMNDLIAVFPGTDAARKAQQLVQPYPM